MANDSKNFSRISTSLAAIALYVACTVSEATAAPSIFWASDPIGPNQTVLVVGDGLGNVKSISFRRLTDGIDLHSAQASGESTILQPVQQGDQSIKFVVPAHIEPGAYSFTLIGSDGSASGHLNTPSIYWIQGDAGASGTPGGWIRVFGRDIGRSNDATLELSQSGNRSRTIRLKAEKWSLWDTQFLVPLATPPGEYRLTLWNGQGDSDCRRFAGTIAVKPSRQRSDFSVRVTSFGAVGDGHHDDTAAINAALGALAVHGGGTVLFPRGRYLVTGTVNIPDRVTLRGEARQLVSLNWLDIETPPPAFLAGIADFAVRDMTIYASNYSTVISGGFTGVQNSTVSEKAQNIEIDNVAIRASAYRGHITPEKAMQRYAQGTTLPSRNGPVAIKLTGRNLKITNSDVYGSGSAFLLLRPRDAYIGNNVFRNGHGWYSITGPDRVIFEHNEVSGADLQSTGGGINTLATGIGSSRNVIFFENSFSLLSGWDREAMTSDGPGGYYYGPVKAAGNKKLSLVRLQTTIDQTWMGAGVFILGGRGAGEYASIEGFSPGVVELDTPLTVPPDDSSIISIVPMQQHYLMIANAFSDTGVAIQFFGTSVEHVVAQNISIRTGGFLARSLIYGHPQPSWYNQFLGNVIREGNAYGTSSKDIGPAEAVIGAYGMPSDLPSAPLTRGMVIRENTLENDSQIEIKGGDRAASPGVADVVVEDNAVSHSEKSVVVDQGTRDVFLRGNQLVDIPKPTVASPP